MPSLAATGSRWFIANVGREKAITPEVRFLAEADPVDGGVAWIEETVKDRVASIPTVLEPNDATFRVVMTETRGEPDFLPSMLLRGEITRLVIDIVGRRGIEHRVFPIPRRPQD